MPHIAVRWDSRYSCCSRRSGERNISSHNFDPRAVWAIAPRTYLEAVADGMSSRFSGRREFRWTLRPPAWFLFRYTLTISRSLRRQLVACHISLSTLVGATFAMSTNGAGLGTNALRFPRRQNDAERSGSRCSEAYPRRIRPSSDRDAVHTVFTHKGLR